MYLSNLKLWNFRKFGAGNNNLDLGKADLEVSFTRGLNVLIGKNDSGKTAIIDAIKLVLKTHSPDWIKVDSEDFNNGTDRLRIECKFDDLSDEEAKNFTEWLGMEGDGDSAEPFLRVMLDACKKVDRVLPFDIRAGVDEDGYPLSAEAKEYLRTTFLRPLRDAKTELVPRKNSRLSQILMGHPTFKDKDDDHELVRVFTEFNKKIKGYFNAPSEDGAKVKKALEDFLSKFFGEEKTAVFSPAEQKLKNILETLKLSLEDEKLGLGSHNLLFIATELLNLEREDWYGLRLGLIEEIEAHLYPQAQLRVIEFLQKETSEEGVQLILTTHSPNLASKVNLKNLIICHEGNVFPMGSDYTKLDEVNYKFLQRFLDVTKANLFFAKGVILVEGWSEELLLPALATKIDINLTEKGISVVNVGNTSFLGYSKIFLRQAGQEMNIPVAVITDLDVKPDEENQSDEYGKTKKEVITKMKAQKYDGQKVKTFVSHHWTIEYCLAKSSTLGKTFHKIVMKVHPQIGEDNFIKIVSDKLIKGSLNKTEIAYQLAQALEDDSKKKSPEITINKKNDSIGYLLDAIKYAARENTDN